MSLKDFQHKLFGLVIGELWRQWNSIGAAGGGEMADPRLVIDPEALSMATIVFARRDARLFDEAMDWLQLNGSLLNQSRFHRFMQNSKSPHAISTGAAIFEALGIQAKAGAPRAVETCLPTILFQNEFGEFLPRPRRPDETFLKFGLLRERIALRGLSVPFPSSGVATLLLQLRALIGISSRCELFCLLAARPSVAGAEAAFLAGYTPRSIQENLADMSKTRFVSCRRVGKEIRYSIDPDFARGFLPKKTALLFPPSAILFSTLDRIAHIVQQCIERNATHRVAVTVLRKELESAATTLSRAGLPTAFNRTLSADSKKFVEALERDVVALMKEWGG